MEMMTQDNRFDKIEKQIERDIKRLAELYTEISEIVTRMHLFGMELGAIRSFLKQTEEDSVEKGEE